MHPKTKRRIIYAIIAIGVIIIVAVIGYETLGPSVCNYPCEWVFPGRCWCPLPGSSTPPPGGTSLPEGIPGFPWEAALLGILVAVVLVLTIRRRNR